MEQSVPHPRRLIQCQPADETLQKVNTQQHSQTSFVTMTYHRQKPHSCNILYVTNRGVLTSLIRKDAFVTTSCFQP